MANTLEEANAIIAQQKQHIEELASQLQSAHRQLMILQHQVEQLLRRVYGKRSEKLDPNQLMFDSLVLETLNQPVQPSAPIVQLPAQSTPTKKNTKKEKRNHPGRIPIPDHLERVEIVLDIPEDQRICPETGKPLKQIGEEVSEKLEYRPGKLIVNVYKRPKYASPDSVAAGDVGIITAPMPDSPIDKCKADVGLLSHIIVSKFADHLPIYRQNGIFRREGIEIPRATQNSWCLQVYDAIQPLEQVLRGSVLDGDTIFTDDSIIPLLVKGNGKVKKGRLWVYVRGGPGPLLTAFDFSPDRSKQRPLAFMEEFKGYVHADAYGGYDELFRREGIIEVGCWCHARRKFDEAIGSRQKEATEILARIAQLYKVESACKEMEPEDRCRFRQEHAKPILDGIFERIEGLKAEVLPSEPLRTAVDYALNQKGALHRYLESGWLKPDNNTAENAIRPLALGRKNWIFSSERGARATALYLGLIQSCIACDVNPWEYFNDMLRRIMAHPVRQLRELLPDQWKPLPKDDHGLVIMP
jgi:transposase/prefoldin subunit 5